MDSRCVNISVTLICLLQNVSMAQTLPSSAPQTASLRTMSSADSQLGVLILVDGRVVNGKFTPRPDGYDVQLAVGRIFIGSDRVRFVARDLSDAYDRMRASQPSFSPDVHLDLARWCLNNRLPEQARREVLDALHLDPNRSDAKRMLELLVAQEGGSKGTNKGSSTSAGSGLTEFPTAQKSAGPAIEMRSLAGLSRPVAQEFTRHVQPLMMNKCANSGCHGTRHTGNFQLTSTHRGTSPAIAERNLAAVLKQVDLTNPNASPLLEALDGSHGGANTPLFRGRSGSQQMAVLRQWVNSVARDINPDAGEESLDASGQMELVSASRIVTDDSVSSDPLSGSRTEDSPHGKQISRAETDKRLLTQAMQANANDAFDPAAFNARYHGSNQRNSSVQATPNPFAQPNPLTEQPLR
jgi:hypothetical protein